MKESVLDVLMYLFQNYMGDETDIHPDRDSVQSELVEAGFPSREVSQAFEWLDGLAARLEETPAVSPNGDSAFRIYTDQEIVKLNPECQGYLLFLEQVGILDCDTRELIIDRVMALTTNDIDLIDLKWIILMVLFSHPGQEEAYAWMEGLMFDEDEVIGYLH
jgi:Smg protein